MTFRTTPATPWPRTSDGARFQHLDITKESDWQAAVRAAEDWASPVDVLINNAAIIIYGGVEHQTPEDFRRILE